MNRNWKPLYEQALDQCGYFTTQQALAAGISNQSLYQQQKSGNLEKIRHGIYRFEQLPTSEDEDLMVVWLWSNQEGIFGLETALRKHNLSDVLPRQIDIVLPTTFSKTKKVPAGVRVRYADLPKSEWSWFGAIPITTIQRTLLDLAKENEHPEIIEQAITEGIQKGLFALKDVSYAARYVSRYFLGDEGDDDV